MQSCRFPHEDPLAVTQLSGDRASIRFVRRQGFWCQWPPKLGEGLAQLIEITTEDCLCVQFEGSLEAGK